MRILIIIYIDLLARLKLSWRLIATFVFLLLLDTFISEALNLRTIVSFHYDAADRIILLSLLLIGIFSFLAWVRKSWKYLRYFAMICTGVIILKLSIKVAQIFLTLSGVNGGKEALRLMMNAIVVWVANIALFAILYWLLDHGGPEERQYAHRSCADFAFPLQQQEDGFLGWFNWSPSFLDYLFLAFNTNTAFSPTDTMILSQRAKALTMIQAAISLLILAGLAARAVNIFQ